MFVVHLKRITYPNFKMIRRLYLLTAFSILLYNLYGQKLEFNIDGNLNKLTGEWINDFSNTKLLQDEIGIYSMQFIILDTLNENFSNMLCNYLNDLQYPIDSIDLKFISYGKVVFDSYKHQEKFERQAYCGIINMDQEEYLLMFSDLEEKDQFIAFLFNFRITENGLFIRHRELGEIAFIKK